MICVSIAEPTHDLILKAIKNEEIAEIRLDLTESLSEEDIELIFSQDVKLIATCRPGRYSDSERSRILMKAVESGAAYVDIELESPEDFKRDITAKAKEKGCKVIISYHDYGKTPPKEELDRIIEWCFDSGADIAKIVCMVRNNADNAKLLSLYRMNKDIIVFGMGKKSKFTRIIAPLLGAPFTYASLSPGRETGDGQIDKAMLVKFLELFKSV